MASTAINYPFTLDSLGKIVSTSDDNKIYLDKIMTLLSTMVGQRPMQPMYGTDILRALYECGEDYDLALRDAINRAMATFLPAVSVNYITIEEPDNTGVSKVTITFSFPDGSTNEVSLNSSYLNNDGTQIGDIL